MSKIVLGQSMPYEKKKEGAYSFEEGSETYTMQSHNIKNEYLFIVTYSHLHFLQELINFT